MVDIMKKLLGIVILSFILSNKTNAEIFEMKNCYYQGNDTEWAQAEWIKDSSSAKANINSSTGKLEYTNEKFSKLEDVILSIDTNRQMIFLTKKFTDFYINNGKTIAKWYETDLGKLQKEEILKGETGVAANSFWKAFIRGLTNRQKFELREYTLLTYAGGIVIGQLINDNLIVEEKIYIDLEKGTYITGWKLDGNNLPQMGGYICNNQIASKDDGSNGSSGTAFFINNKGHLLTNYHVVQGCTLSKISYKNKDYDTKLIATDKTLDLALLKSDLIPKSFFTFSKNEAKKLNKVYVAGYPLGKGLSDDLKISSGIISSLKGFEDNSNEIQIDAPINPGNSGGPIINENGDLVAIAVSGLAKDLTEGINFGIKSSSAEIFLRTNKINIKKSMYSGIKDNDRLLEILEEGTVYTYCN
tara:strand:- start:503 stop:1747 length:1245 start_codon:yes stop_codon:yes gene_type:complete